MFDSQVSTAFARLVAGFVGPNALPAGGAAGVTSIAMGIALGVKVLRMSAPSTDPEAAAGLESLVERATEEFSADCTAFDNLLVALRQPEEAPDRTATIRGAWRAATEAPVRVVSLASQADRFLADHSDGIKEHLRGDLKAARILIRAGREIALSNAKENAQHLDPAIAEHVLSGFRDETIE